MFKFTSSNYATKDSFSHNIILPLREMFIVIWKRKTKSFPWTEENIFYFLMWCLYHQLVTAVGSPLFVLLPFWIVWFPFYPPPQIYSQQSLPSYLTLNREIIQFFRGKELDVLQYSDNRLSVGLFLKKGLNCEYFNKIFEYLIPQTHFQLPCLYLRWKQNYKKKKFF